MMGQLSRSFLRVMVFGVLGAVGVLAPAPAVVAQVVDAPTDRKDNRVNEVNPIVHMGDTVAVNPRRNRVLIAARKVDIASGSEPCVIYRSTDGGLTWGDAGALPQFSGRPCGHVAVRWSPDGALAYAATVERNWMTGGDTLAFSVSEDDGLTWTGGIAFQDWNAYETLLGLSLAVPLPGGNPRAVYLAIIGRDYDVDEGSVMALRSLDGGESWNEPVVFERARYSMGQVQLSDPVIATGPGKTVAVAWRAHITAGEPSFELRFASSIDDAATFGPVSVVQRRPQGDDSGYAELIPDLAIGPSGSAHLVFSSDMLAEGDEDAYYTWSSRPYSTWAGPVRISDGPAGTMQAAPKIALQKCGTNQIVHVVWRDTRWYTEIYPRLAQRIDLSYTRKVALPGFSWSASLRVSNLSGHLTGIQLTDIAVGGSRIYALWTRFHVRQAEADLVGSNIVSGITCS